jgi:hypothetical protein
LETQVWWWSPPLGLTRGQLAQTLGEPVTVLKGRREIEAADNDGLSEASARRYPAPPVWLCDRTARIPGAISGEELASRFSDAVKTTDDSGQLNVRNPDVRAHLREHAG